MTTASTPNGDGLYEQLVILTGVQITTTDTFTVSGSLTDSEGGEIDYTSANASLQPGTRFVSWSSTAFASAGTAPTALTPWRNWISTTPLKSAQRFQWAISPETTSTTTFAYRAGQFPAVLRFSGLPDQWVQPGEALNPAFNVRDYAQHALASSDQITYTVMENTALYAGVVLTDSGALLVNPQANWQGSSQVTIQASYAEDVAQDSFTVQRRLAEPALPAAHHALQQPLQLAQLQRLASGAQR